TFFSQPGLVMLSDVPVATIWKPVHDVAAWIPTDVRETFHAGSPPAAPKHLTKAGISLPDRGNGVKDANRMASAGIAAKLTDRILRRCSGTESCLRLECRHTGMMRMPPAWSTSHTFFDLLNTRRQNCFVRPE